MRTAFWACVPRAYRISTALIPHAYRVRTAFGVTKTVLGVTKQNNGYQTKKKHNEGLHKQKQPTNSPQSILSYPKRPAAQISRARLHLDAKTKLRVISTPPSLGKSGLAGYESEYDYTKRYSKYKHVHYVAFHHYVRGCLYALCMSHCKHAGCYFIVSRMFVS